MITSLKRYIGELDLSKSVKDVGRIRGVYNLDTAKTVGIVFDAGNDADFELVRKYVNYLREMKKKVRAIGFYDAKSIPSVSTSKLEYDFLSNGECNWYGRPKGAVVENFIGEDFDILLDLNLNQHFCLKWMTGMSKAKFKVGPSGSSSDSHDLIIEVAEEKGLKFLLRQIDSYLLKLNKE